MRKTPALAIVAMAAIALAAGLTACGDDDNNNPEDFRTIDSALVGTWECNETDKDKTETHTIVFNSDGTYTATETDTYNNGNVVTDWDSGKWSTNVRKDRIHFTVTSSSDPGDIGDEDYDNYRVDGAVLFMGGNEYTSVTGGVN